MFELGGGCTQSKQLQSMEVPQFNTYDFKTYREEVDVWRKESRVAKVRPGLLLWLELPHNHPSWVKELIMTTVRKDDLMEDGAEKFIEAMEEAFRFDNNVQCYGKDQGKQES